MGRFSVLVSVVLVLIVVQQNSSNPIHKFKQHLNLTKEFHCKHPRPVVYYWNEILPDELRSKVDRLFPAYTVLYKCGDRCGGCDSPKKRCVPKGPPTIKNVVFHKYEKTSPVPSYLELELEEHTSCHCVAHDFKGNPIK